MRASEMISFYIELGEHPSHAWLAEALRHLLQTGWHARELVHGPACQTCRQAYSSLIFFTTFSQRLASAIQTKCFV